MLSIFTKKYLSIPVCKIGLLIAGISIFSSTVNAQTVVPQQKEKLTEDSLSHKIVVGLSGGLSLNQFSKGQPHTGSNTGYTAGLAINYQLLHSLSLQLEANFLQQGGTTITFKDDTRLGLPESFQTKNVKNSSYKINSIDIPLLVNYAFDIRQSWFPSIYLGGSYGYTLSVNEKYQRTGNLLPGEDIIATATTTQSVTSRFNSSGVNFIAGANVKLPISGKLMLLIDMRYMNGLTPVMDNYSYMEKVGFGSDLRTNSFISKVGVLLPL